MTSILKEGQNGLYRLRRLKHMLNTRTLKKVAEGLEMAQVRYCL